MVTAANAAVSQYRINPDDELEINVWGEQRLQRDVRVLPDGTVNFPLVGQILAQGRLTRDIEAAVTDGLRSQYRGEVPQVTVSVKKPSGLSFSVMGKVHTAGTFAPGRFVNVLEAISLAGGPNEFANLNNVMILRKTTEGLQPIHVRLGSVFRSNPSRDQISAVNIPTIMTGDTVIVP
ncbi:MAG TPA: polysaccharide biosynthesis/export family protein [Novosphingobium sp.]|nr:polysaccharide biosynthesis/export family protein [Novosphingobium sp.]